MKRQFALAALLVAAGPLLAPAASVPTRTPNSAALSPDQVAIYGAFLRYYVEVDPGTVNLANQTYRLTPASLSPDRQCLEGMDFDRHQARHSHRLDSTLAELVAAPVPGPGGEPSRVSSDNSSRVSTDDAVEGVKLVDRASQRRALRSQNVSHAIAAGESPDEAVARVFSSSLLEMSEIAFDANHQHAVLSYRYSCGPQCGHRGTIVFTSLGTVWVPMARRCIGTGS